MIISISVVTAKEFATIRASRASVSCARRFVSDSNVVFPSGNALFRRRIRSAEFPEVFKSSSFVFHVTENDRNFRAVNFYFRFFFFFLRTIFVPSAFSFSVGIELFFTFFLDTHPPGPARIFSFCQAFFYFLFKFFFLTFRVFVSNFPRFFATREKTCQAF